jgi:hypothetical protein
MIPIISGWLKGEGICTIIIKLRLMIVPLSLSLLLKHSALISRINATAAVMALMPDHLVKFHQVLLNTIDLIDQAIRTWLVLLATVGLH